MWVTPKKEEENNDQTPGPNNNGLVHYEYSIRRKVEEAFPILQRMENLQRKECDGFVSDIYLDTAYITGAIQCIKRPHLKCNAILLHLRGGGPAGPEWRRNGLVKKGG